MDIPSLLKEWAPIASQAFAPCILGVIKLLWDISIRLKNIEKLLEDQGKQVESHEGRIDIHDQIFSEFSGKHVSSKLILQKLQTIPRFNGKGNHKNEH